MGKNRKASKKNRRRDRFPVKESSSKEPTKPGEEGKSPSSLGNQGSSSGVSRAGKHDIEEQSEVPAEEIPSSGTVNDKLHCRDPIPTGHGNEVLSLGGDEAKVYVGGYQRKEEAEVNSLERLTDEDEIKSERPCAIGSTCKRQIEDLQKTIADLENVIANLQKSDEQFRVMVDVREIHSNFRSSPRAEDFDGEMKKVLEQMATGIETDEIDRICAINKKTSFTRILFAMLFQKAKQDVKSRFINGDWHKGRLFPKFDNDGTEYGWWKENWELEIVEKRLGIMRQAANKWNPKRKMFTVHKMISDFNIMVHPDLKEIKLSEKTEIKHEGVDILDGVLYLFSSGRESSVSLNEKI